MTQTFPYGLKQALSMLQNAGRVEISKEITFDVHGVIAIGSLFSIRLKKRYGIATDKLKPSIANDGSNPL